LQDQLQSETVALKRIERSSEGVTHEVGGKYVTFPIRTKRNHGVGARGEMEALPIAQRQSYSSARVGLKYLYGSLELSGQTFELAEKNAQAFTSALDEELKGLRESLSKDLNRQVYGTNTGALATATGGTTTTFVTTDEDAIYLEEGMVVDVLDSSASYAVIASAATITSVTSTGGNTTATIDATASAIIASGDLLVRDNSYNKELTGLRQIVAATGQVYNIDPASVSVWKSTVNSNGGTNRALSEGLLIKLMDDVRKQGGGQPTVLFSNVGVRRAYFNLLVQQRRYSNTTEFEGGFKGLAFTTDQGDVPFVSDFDCPRNRVFAVNEKQVKVYEAGDWSFMNRDGSNWQRVITSAGSFDAYSATLYKYMEIGTHRRNSHGLLSDVTEG
ncbi:MAG TPA: phage major capsid protein, partial [Allocoleopsis sp.]